MSWPATQAGRPASWGALALRFALGLRVLADALVEGSAPPSRPLSRAAAWGLAPGCRAPPPTRLSPGKHLSPAASVCCSGTSLPGPGSGLPLPGAAFSGQPLLGDPLAVWRFGKPPPPPLAWSSSSGPCASAPAWRPLPRRLRSARRLPPARPPRASALPVWPAFVVPLAPLVSWTALLTGLLVSGSWWFWSFLPKSFPPARGDRCLFTLQVKH